MPGHALVVDGRQLPPRVERGDPRRDAPPHPARTREVVGGRGVVDAARLGGRDHRFDASQRLGDVEVDAVQFGDGLIRLGLHPGAQGVRALDLAGRVGVQDGDGVGDARARTGDLLRESGVPVTELRAGIIVGAGSAAFEVMRDMVYNLPVLTPPRWVRSRTTPVALENLLVDLVELLNHPSDAHRVFEAAGPEVLSYQQQFIRFMAVSGKHRPLIPIPLPTRWISVWFLNVITSVPPTIAKALIQGLKHDLIADDRALRALIPQTLIPFDQAVRRTLKEEEQLVNSSDWGYDAQAFARWRPEYGYYPKQAGCTVATQASRQALWQVVNQIGGEEGYFFGNLLWKTRGAMDLLVGHRLAKGRPQRAYLQTGDTVDSWKVIIVEEEKQLTLLFGMKAPGLGRLSFTINDKGDRRELDVRAWWHPHGMPGLFYWLLMIPAHLFIFRGMARRIAHLAEQITIK